MAAPDKIYIPVYPNHNLNGVHLGDDWMYEPHKECDNVEYIRKDALVPDNLDEAANNCIAEFADYIMDENTPEEINLTEKLREIFKAGVLWMARQHANDVAEAIESAFNAGKEWMAGQGFISEGIIYQTSGKDTIIDLNEHIDYLEDCDKVIVNIRKKEENYD